MKLVYVKDAQALAALERAPEVFRRQLHADLARGAEMLQKRAQGMVRSNSGARELAARITVLEEGELSFRITPAVQYAVFVEKGTGPAVGKPRYYPNPDALMDYLITNTRYRGHKWSRPGSKKRLTQEEDLHDRSRAWAWHIYNRGTKPQPFMRPAFEETKPAILALLKGGAARAAAEVERGG